MVFPPAISDDDSRELEMVSFFALETDWTDEQQSRKEYTWFPKLQVLAQRKVLRIGVVAGLLCMCVIATRSFSGNWKTTKLFAKMSLPPDAVKTIDDFPTSVQAKAYSWISTALSSNQPSSTGTLESMTTSDLQQLFALVATHFALDGENWPVPGFEVCKWNSIDCRSDNIVEAAKFYQSGADAEQKANIPAEFFSMLPQLEVFYLTRYSNLGPLHELLPSEMGTARYLKDLRIYENGLSGSIPSVLGELTSLSYLDLSRNQALSGSIPSQLFALRSLRHLKIKENLLQGTIPSENMYRLNRLQGLELQKNNLTGTLPSDLGFLTQTTILLLSENTITGAIPTEMGRMKGLVDLGLSSLNMSGTLPTELGLLTKILKMEMDHTPIEGKIPSEIGLLTFLYRLNLASTNITGTIPKEVESLHSLSHLCLDNTTISELGTYCHYQSR